jgi:hypothetical protein
MAVAPVRVLVGAAAAVGLLVPAFTSSPAANHDAAGPCPSASGQEVVQTVPLPGEPGFLLLTRTTLWVAIPGSRPGRPGRVVRVDPRSGRIRGTFPLPIDPYRLAVGFGSLWITGAAGPGARRYQGGVLRVDPRSGRVLSVIRGPRSFGSALAATADGVWVGGADVYAQGRSDETVARWIYKIDPARNSVVRSVHLTPTTVIDLVGDGSSLWATGWGAVVKVSASGRLLAQQRFDGSGWSMALAPGAVWVAQPFFGNRRRPREQRPARRLLRVTTSKPQRVTVVELGAQPGDVAAASGVVWVGAGGLGRIEATRTAPTLTKVAVDVVPNRIEAFPGGAWVTELRRSELIRVC